MFLLISLALPASVFANPVCSALYSESSSRHESATNKPNHWQIEFFKAVADNRWVGQFYALLNLTIDSAAKNKIPKSDIKQLKQLAFEFELASLENTSNGVAGNNHTGALFNILGLTSLLQKNVFGVQHKSNFRQSLKGLRSVAADLFFAFGPLLWSLLRVNKVFSMPHDQVIKAMIQTAEQNSILTNLANLHSTSLAAARSELSDRLNWNFSNYVSRLPFSLWGLGRKLVPWMIALPIYSLGVTPIDFTSIVTNGLRPYPYRLYSDSEFMSDINRQVGDIKNGKTLLIYNDRLFAETDGRPNVAKGVKIFDGFPSENLNTKNFDSVEEILNMDLSSYDNVVILAHGSPDSFSTNMQLRPNKKMKKGANLIFLSCLVGQKGETKGEDEQWIQFSRTLLNGGKAFVSTQLILADLDFNKMGEATNPEQHKQNVMKEKGSNFILGATGVLPAAIVGYNAYWAWNNEYYFKPKGLRIYDSSTNTTTYIPSENPQKTNTHSY